MSSLYVIEQGLAIRQEHERLILCRDKKHVAEIPLLKLERLILFGRVHVTTGAISALLRHGVDTTFFSWHGRLKGRLVSLESKNIPLRLKQYERAHDEAFALELVRRIVCAKIESSRRALFRYQRNHPDWNPGEALGELEQALRLVERARSRESLWGLEGQAAAAYFRAYSSMFRRSLSFSRRSRRPPQDPVNAALSLGYALLFGEALAVVAAVGFDPYLGFLHAPEYGRCSLALDLMEEFRAAIVDRLALTLFNREVFLLEHFTASENGGVWFRPEAKKRFLQEYENTMRRPFISKRSAGLPDEGWSVSSEPHAFGGEERTTFRRLLFRQAERLAQVILNGGEYKPYIAEP